MTTPQTSAVAVIEQPVIEQSLEAGVVTWNLDDFPADRFNRLLPMQTIVIPNDLFKPAYQVIVADRPDRDGKSADTYKSSDVPPGHRAPTARLLRKFSTAAGITFSDEHRLDDGTNPDVLGVTMQASMVLPSGQRVSAPGSQLIDIRTWFKKDKDGAFEHPAEVAKFRKQFYANVATRAMSRAIRGLLGLRSSYPEAELAKPFLVVSYVLNMNHQDVRARVLDAFMPVTAQLYGASPVAPKQLASGEITVDEAPEEDPAPTTPTTLPGETLAKAEAAEPSWITGAAAAEPPDFATSLRDTADAVEGGDARAGKDDLTALGQLFDGWQGTGVIAGGFAAIWPDTDVEKLTVGQAHAMVTVADSMGPEAFQAAWREAAQAKAATT